MAQLLDFTKPHILRDEEEYSAAVSEIDRLLDSDPPPDSEDYEFLEFLSVLVQAYEDEHFPIREGTTPQEVVDFMLEQKGLSRSDLASWIQTAICLLASGRAKPRWKPIRSKRSQRKEYCSNPAKS